jgi:branched-chain amino acid transport system ATP-binding protein
MLKIENLTVAYGGIEALKGINLEVPEGSIVTLIGANGAGKSTTLRSIMSLVKCKAGKITYNGEDITGLRTSGIVARGITLVPEGRRVFPNLSVVENLMIGAYLRSDKEGIEKDLNWVYDLFPRLKETYLADGRNAFRRRTANAGRGSGPDVPSQNHDDG